MPGLPFRLVDVFAPRPFSGNQLCVVTDAADLDPDGMLRLATEIAFSETTFVLGAGGDRYDVRIFTPEAELPFAGHPTLGTAYVLAAEGRVDARVIQRCAAGDIPVEVDVEGHEAWMTQLPPTFGDVVEDREPVARAAGLTVDDLDPALPVQAVSTGLPPLIVPVRDLETLRRAWNDPRLAAQVCEATATDELYLFAVGEGGVTARYFGTSFAILEDPATGSAAGPLGAYLARYGLAEMPGRVLVRQGEQVGRPSELHLEVEPDGDSWRIRVGGNVHVVGEGTWTG